jgi:hypothetical protein
MVPVSLRRWYMRSGASVEMQTAPVDGRCPGEAAAARFLRANGDAVAGVYWQWFGTRYGGKQGRGE